MKFSFSITLTDEDYFEFNKFHSLESHYGVNKTSKLRWFVTALLGVVILAACFVGGFDSFFFSYSVAVLVLLVCYNLFWRQLMSWSIKSSLKHLKKKGKLAYSPFSTLEFGVEGIVETTDVLRVEQKYSAIERVSVVEGRYIYIHNSNLGAYIIPMSAFSDQSEYESFLDFLATLNIKTDIYKGKKHSK